MSILVWPSCWRISGAMNAGDPLNTLAVAVWAMEDVCTRAALLSPKSVSLATTLHFNSELFTLKLVKIKVPELNYLSWASVFIWRELGGPNMARNTEHLSFCCRLATSWSCLNWSTTTLSSVSTVWVLTWAALHLSFLVCLCSSARTSWSSCT